MKPRELLTGLPGHPTHPPLTDATIMELAGLEPATSWVRSRRSPN
jgi:hypothetical protein